jgi:hypothetical protein
MQKTMFKSVWSTMMLAVLSAFMSIGFQSCSKDDDDDGGGGDPIDVSVVGKWTVDDPNGDYGSFEFTEDSKYIITQRTTTPPARSASVRAPETVYIIILFGDISSLKGSDNEYTIDLKDFGLIKFYIDPKNGTATVMAKGETYTTKKEKEVEASDSDRTELLCHTWKVKLTPEDGLIEKTVTFSKSGTYLIYEKYLNPWDENGNYVPNRIEETASYVTWEWHDKEQVEIYYRWPPYEDKNDDGVIDDRDCVDGVVKIKTLNTKTLITVATNENGDGDYIEFYRD